MIRDHIIDNALEALNFSEGSLIARLTRQYMKSKGLVVDNIQLRDYFRNSYEFLADRDEVRIDHVRLELETDEDNDHKVSMYSFQFVVHSEFASVDFTFYGFQIPDSITAEIDRLLDGYKLKEWLGAS
jgi:hypothetical protein